MSEASSEGAKPDDGRVRARMARKVPLHVSHSADDGASETTDLASVTDEPHEYRWKKEASAGRGQGAAVDDMRFTFQRRYAKLNWRTISQTSLERIVERIDTRSLEQMLEPLAFARLRLGDVSSVPEEWILKLLRLYQLCLEYLMNVKAHLLQRLSDAAAEASEKGDAAVSLRTRCARLRAELKAAQRDALQRSKALDAYSKMLRVHGDKNAFGPAAAQFLVHTDSGGGGKGGGSSTRRSGRVSRKPVVVVLDSRSGEREPAEPADYDLLARAKAAEKEVASLQEQLSKSGAFAPEGAVNSRIDSLQRMWDQERQHWEEERQHLAEKLNEANAAATRHQLAAETASAEARRLQALADELPVQRERAEEAEGQLSQERRSFVEKRQAWQAEREEMERSMQRMKAEAEEQASERRVRALGHAVAIGGTVIRRRAFAHWRVGTAALGAGESAYKEGEESQRTVMAQEHQVQQREQLLRRVLRSMQNNRLRRGMRQWQAFRLLADVDKAEVGRRECAVQAQSAQAAMERAAAEQARREEARQKRRRRVLETTPTEVTDAYVEELVGRYTTARDEGGIGEEDKEAMGIVGHRVSAVVGAQMSVAEREGRSLVRRSSAPLSERPFVSSFHPHWESDVNARVNDVGEAVELALEAKGVPADVARHDDDGTLLAALVVDQRESLAPPVLERMRGIDTFLHRQLYPERKGGDEEEGITASGATLPRRDVFDLASEVVYELSGRLPPERRPTRLLQRAMEPVRSRAALRVTRFGTLARGDEPSDGEEDEDNADRLRASRDPSYALVRAATSVLLDTESPRAADARLTTSSDVVRAALVAEARAAAGPQRGGKRGGRAPELEDFDNVLRASREAGVQGGGERGGARSRGLTSSEQHAARRTPWGREASVSRSRGSARGWGSLPLRQGASYSHEEEEEDSTAEEEDETEEEEEEEKPVEKPRAGASAQSHRGSVRHRSGEGEERAGAASGRAAELSQGGDSVSAASTSSESLSPQRERPRARHLDGAGAVHATPKRGGKGAGDGAPVPPWSQSPRGAPTASQAATSAAQAPPPPSPSSAVSASATDWADDTPVPFDTHRVHKDRPAAAAAASAAPAPRAVQARSVPAQESSSSWSLSRTTTPTPAPAASSRSRVRTAGSNTGLSAATGTVSTTGSSPTDASASVQSPAAALVAADRPSSAGASPPTSGERGGETRARQHSGDGAGTQEQPQGGGSWASARPMATSVAASRRSEAASEDTQSAAPASADPESPSMHSWDDESTTSPSARHAPAQRRERPSEEGGGQKQLAVAARAAGAAVPDDQPVATPPRSRVASSWARAFTTQHDSTDEEESVLSSPGQRPAPAPAAAGAAGEAVKDAGTTEVAHFSPSPDSSPSHSPARRGQPSPQVPLPAPAVARQGAASREQAAGGVPVRRPGSAALRNFDDDFDEEDSLEVETL